MRERFLSWSKSVAALQTIALIVLCLLLASAFGLGVIVAQVNYPPPLPPLGMPPRNAPAPVRGTFGAIDRIDGNVIRLRDPRNGRTWLVRTGRDTVIESGPRRPIPLNALRPGQRVFVVGSPGSNEWDAQFIGVVYGQGQQFVPPAQLPVCEDCID
ncbi:MAG: hypothetical protein HY741_10875 [Chloroflexi bacterium]|nr:hypothetical protein [Chloroflexota bacterium]